MSKGKFVIRHRVDGLKNFTAFDNDDHGSPVIEATNTENIGLRMAEHTSINFKSLGPGESIIRDNWEMICEWREETDLHKLARAMPDRLQIVDVS